jgi:hypothetical protein
LFFFFQVGKLSKIQLSMSSEMVLDGLALNVKFDGHTLRYPNQEISFARFLSDVCDGAHSDFVMKKWDGDVADQAAKRTQRNRSALVRDALREHLRRVELRASEGRDRQGYSRQSPADSEAQAWESEAAWPQE